MSKRRSNELHLDGAMLQSLKAARFTEERHEGCQDDYGAQLRSCGTPGCAPQPGRHGDADFKAWPSSASACSSAVAPVLVPKLPNLPQQLADGPQQLATSTMSIESCDTAVVEPVTPRHPQALLRPASQQPFGWSPAGSPIAAPQAPAVAGTAEVPFAQRHGQPSRPPTICLLATASPEEEAEADSLLAPAAGDSLMQEPPASELHAARHDAARAAYEARMEAATRTPNARRVLTYDEADSFLGSLFIHTPKPALPAGCSTAEFDGMHHHAVPAPDPLSSSATPRKAPRPMAAANPSLMFAPGMHVVLGASCSLQAAGFGVYADSANSQFSSTRALHTELEASLAVEHKVGARAGCNVGDVGEGEVGAEDALRGAMRGHILSMLLGMGGMGQC